MGTVLHPGAPRRRRRAYLRFSPLLDGDGVASPYRSAALELSTNRFSPLLDGDGVASRRPARTRSPDNSVSVPFSMGTVLHLSYRVIQRSLDILVSVPFSMGTVLHLVHGRAGRASGSSFQSPSRWGRCCIACRIRRPICPCSVSVPFSM